MLARAPVVGVVVVAACAAVVVGEAALAVEEVVGAAVAADRAVDPDDVAVLAPVDPVVESVPPVVMDDEDVLDWSVAAASTLGESSLHAPALMITAAPRTHAPRRSIFEADGRPS